MQSLEDGELTWVLAHSNILLAFNYCLNGGKKKNSYHFSATVLESLIYLMFFCKISHHLIYI